MEDSKPYGISRRQALGLVGMSMAVIATTSVQAYDPSPHLYDYAQTKAATTNYVKSLAAGSIKDHDGKKHIVHVDKSTKLDSVRPGDLVKAYVTDQGHTTTLRRDN